MAPTYVPCLSVSILLIISALPLIIVGFLIGNRYRRVLNVNQIFFFWIGRDRVVFDMGRTCLIGGILLLGLGILAMWLAFRVTVM